MTAEIIQKYRTKYSKPEMLKKATKVFNEFIRLRDTDENGYGYCISSGQALKVPSKRAQAGHFYPAGKFQSLRFNEDNVHLQGLSDNYYASGNLSNYRLSLIKKIGEQRVKKLDEIAELDTMMNASLSYERLIEVFEEYKAKVKELKKSKSW